MGALQAVYTYRCGVSHKLPQTKLPSTFFSQVFTVPTTGVVRNYRLASERRFVASWLWVATDGEATAGAL